MYVIDALLDLALGTSTLSMFDCRIASCECVKAYFHNHLQIRLHFLNRAIEGHTSGQDETANALSTLIRCDFSDPYQAWFAAVLCFHLIHGDIEAKDLLMSVAEGDAENGEEVVTCIQSLSGNLISALQNADDDRVAVAYFMLLCSWLYEDAGAVNDFLGEASTLQSLVQVASRANEDKDVVRGLCAALLGIVYEFSTKDSPISRRELQPLLTSKLGRERYLDALTQLRQNPLIRDFEVLPQTLASGSGGLPDVYFDSMFVDFLKDNFSRLSRAIDRDPGIEILQNNDGVDRDLVDSLRSQIEERNEAVKKMESEFLSQERKLNQEMADNRRAQETSVAEVNRIKGINEALQRNHDVEIQKAEASSKAKVQEIEKKWREDAQRLNSQLHKVQQESVESIQNTKAATRQEFQNEITRLNNDQAELQQRLTKATNERMSAVEGLKGLENLAKRYKEELEKFKGTIASLQKDLEESKIEADTLGSSKASLEDSLEKLRAENEQLRTKAQDQIWAVKDAEEKARKAEQQAAEKEDARSAVQTELDDLLMVLGEIEEKRTRDKVSSLSMCAGSKHV